MNRKMTKRKIVAVCGTALLIAAAVAVMLAVLFISGQVTVGNGLSVNNENEVSI